MKPLRAAALWPVSVALYMWAAGFFLFDTSSGILKTSCGKRETPAIRVRRSCTTFQEDLRKQPLWIREQQAFKLPLRTPEGGPTVFHCCVQQIYLYISFQAREKEERERENVAFWRSMTKHWGERKFLFLYLYILSFSQENEMAGRVSHHQRRWSLASKRIPLCRIPRLLQVDSLTAFTLAVSLPAKQDDTTKKTAFITFLPVCRASHIRALQ